MGALVSNSDGAFIVGVVLVVKFIYGRLFDDLGKATARHLYKYSFSEQTLCVTDVICGHGLCNSIVFTSFKDCTCVLRVLSTVLAAVSAVIIAFDSETKTVMFMKRRAYIKQLPALWVYTVTASVAAAYHFLQLCRCLAFARLGKNPFKCNKIFSWTCLLFDHVVMYAMFATCLAGTQGSFVALVGVKQLQWEKLCNIYTKFCVQVAIGVAFGVLAWFAMAIVSSISAYHLFRLYPTDPLFFTRVVRWSLF